MSYGYKMRISDQTAQIIRTTVSEIVGESALITLFGSRTDDAAKGGDIDLYIVSTSPIANRAATAARIAGRLQRRLGDQRIDVVLADPDTPHLVIHEVAEKTGVSL
jgi:predicted nucleotidyltransferase